ncbi:MAG: DNA polymerase I [Clostridiales bacterium]|jgi:DNA polymerase-1|nr:DNA polymerase I [Clostridiales bacterium]
MKKFVIIDGNSLANRAFYALPPLSDKNGTPTQAVYGFATMLVKAIGDIKPDYIAAAFDLAEPTFRHKLYDGYKAKRKKMPDELAVQMPILKEMLRIMGIKTVEKAGYEADDVIGTLAKRSGAQNYILTGDRDALQLIDGATRVLLTKRGLSDIHVLTEATLKSDYGLTPPQIIDYKAICGDQSDNIPGVPGIGDKGAMNLLNEYGTLDGVYAAIDSVPARVGAKLREFRDSAYLSRTLATIDTAVPIDAAIEECGYTFPFSADVKNFFFGLEFKSLARRADIFADAGAQANPAQKPPCTVKTLFDLPSVAAAASEGGKRLAVFIGDTVNLAGGFATEYSVGTSYSLLDPGLVFADIIAALKPVLESKETLKIVYDAKSLKKRLDRFGCGLENYSDVKLLRYLVEDGADYDGAAEFLNGFGVPQPEPATGLLFIENELSAALEGSGMHKLYYDLELPLIEVLYDMERAGFKVDLKKLTELGDNFAKRLNALRDEIYALSGFEFNINSPKQLHKALFEDMRLPYPKRGKANSTSADILEPLADNFPIVRKVLDYRFYYKLSATYVDGLKKAADDSGVVRTEFRQTLTSTGRLSSAEPNLQNIPVRRDEGKLLRAAFVSREGNLLVSADYSQIELRLLAHMSRDEKMTRIFNEGGDIHISTAAEVFGIDPSEVTASQRRAAKAVNFGIIYGMSDFGLSTDLGIPLYKAKDYIEKYFERFPGVKRYQEDSVKAAKESGGYAKTIMGRTRRIHELFSPSYNMRQFGERAAMNMPLQGSAADLIKIAMLDVFNALKGMDSRLILQIHDELIIDAPEREVERVKTILRTKMEGAVKLSVPLAVDIGVGKSWFDCK